MDSEASPHTTPIEFSGGPWDGESIDLPQMPDGELPAAIEPFSESGSEPLRGGNTASRGRYVRARRVTSLGRIIYQFVAERAGHPHGGPCPE